MTSSELIHALPAFVDLLALVFLSGTTVSLAFILLPVRTIEAERLRLLLLRWFVLSIVLSLIAAVFVLAQKTVEMSAQNLHALTRLLPVVLLDTHYGIVWIMWIATLSVLGLAAWRCNRTKNLRPFIALACIGVTVLAWTHSASGHAADSGDFTLKQCIDGLHILAGTLWLGALTIFILGVAPALRDKPAGDALFVILLQRLSRLALVAFVIVLGTGLYNLKQHIRTLAILWQQPYGEILTLKLVLVTGMLLLAIVMRYCNMPRLQHNSSSEKLRASNSKVTDVVADSSRGRLLHRVKRLLLLEAILGIGVIYLVAMLTHEMPPI